MIWGFLGGVALVTWVSVEEGAYLLWPHGALYLLGWAMMGGSLYGWLR